MHRKFLNLLTACAAVAVFVSCSAAHASLITNGDFEDTTGTFPNGWTVSGGVASQESGTAQNQVISGSESLRVAGSSGNVQQTVGDSLSDFVFSFDWLRPFSTIPTQRMMNTHVRQGNATPFINMRVSGNEDIGGAFQLFGGGSWQNLDPSGPATELILATETAYTFTITGSGFGTATPTYDLSVVGGSVNETFTGLAIYQNTPDTAGETVSTVRFNRGSSHGSATFDNVSLTAIPEPSTLMIAFMGAAAFAYRRR